MATDTNTRQLRRVDLIPDGSGPAGPVELRPMLGMWRNANGGTWGVHAVELTERDGRVQAHAWAADPVAGELHDWGTTPIDAVYADGPRSRQVCGYRAAFTLPHARTEIQVNVLHSISVCAAFTTFTDGSGRVPYMSREFLHRRGEQSPPDAGPDAGADESFARGDDRLPQLFPPVDPAPLLGRWVNTDAGTGGIAEVELVHRDGEVHLHAVAAGPDGPVGWPAARVALHADLSVTGGARGSVPPVTGGVPAAHFADLSATGGGPAFLAAYDHGAMRVHLQGRYNIGILPIVFFTEFVDGSGRNDYVLREVFVR